MHLLLSKNDFIHCSMPCRVASLLVILLVLSAFPAITAAEDEKQWSAEVYVKRYFGSHTSFEFGNPFDPYQEPLSRLEFPLNVWWTGGEFRRHFYRISMGMEILRNISKESDGAFKDSDWTDGANPSVKTIYSESECRMEPSYMVRGDVDMKVGDWLGLPGWFDLRPVAGVRWQRFELVAHDGVQTLPAPPISFRGDAIRFKQTYWQYFVGIRTMYDMARHIKVLPLKLICQLDWAYVEGDNRDHHLLRSGNRVTYEKTKGSAWHASLGVKAALAENINAGIAFEYLMIKTTGNHRLVNDAYGIDFSWDHGVKVWSEQKNLMMNLEYSF